MNIFDYAQNNPSQDQIKKNIYDAQMKMGYSSMFPSGRNQARPQSYWDAANQRANSVNPDTSVGYSLSGSSGTRHGVDPATQQRTQADAAQQNLRDQYSQQMNSMQLQNAQSQSNSNWNTEQMLNQRLAGSNPGAQSPGGVAGPWGDSAAQQMLSYYMMKNLGLSVPSIGKQAFQGMQESVQGGESPLGFQAQSDIGRMSPYDQSQMKAWAKKKRLSSANSLGG